jgi:hypothetical protein
MFPLSVSLSSGFAACVGLVAATAGADPTSGRRAAAVAEAARAIGIGGGLILALVLLLSLSPAVTAVGQATVATATGAVFLLLLGLMRPPGEGGPWLALTGLLFGAAVVALPLDPIMAELMARAASLFVSGPDAAGDVQAVAALARIAAGALALALAGTAGYGLASGRPWGPAFALLGTASAVLLVRAWPWTTVGLGDLLRTTGSGGAAG